MLQENKKKEHGKNTLLLSVNETRFEWHDEYITGAEIRKLGNIPAGDEIFLAIKHPWKDEPIMDDTRVNLARPEVEHFYSKDQHFKVVLTVNLREKPWTKKTINFEEVVTLAYGNYDPRLEKGYTVTYDRGPHQKPGRDNGIG